MSNNLTSNHQIFDKILFIYFQTATMWIFKGDFPVLHFLFCQKFENSHTKSGLFRSETLFLNIDKICCFLKKGGCLSTKMGYASVLFSKRGPRDRFPVPKVWLVVDWLRPPHNMFFRMAHTFETVLLATMTSSDTIAYF